MVADRVYSNPVGIHHVVSSGGEVVVRWGRLPLPPMTTAVVLTGIVGWVDEAIQAVLPNRVYDLRDVAFNLVAASISVASIRLVEWARRSEYEA